MFGGKDKTKTFLLPILDSLAERCKLIDNKKISKENKKNKFINTYIMLTMWENSVISNSQGWLELRLT